MDEEHIKLSLPTVAALMSAFADEIEGKTISVLSDAEMDSRKNQVFKYLENHKNQIICMEQIVILSKEVKDGMDS